MLAGARSMLRLVSVQLHSAVPHSSVLLTFLSLITQRHSCRVSVDQWSSHAGTLTATQPTPIVARPSIAIAISSYFLTSDF